MKLTEEQIAFIDNRLEMMGAKFLDIRYEMVDHIASIMEEKEGDFETNFKEYYVSNWHQLTVQYKQATSWRMFRALKYYWKVLMEPASLVLFTVLFIGTYILTQFAEDIHDITYYTFFPIMALFIPLIWLARKDRKVSTLRSVVQLHGAFYCVYAWSGLMCDIIIDRGDRMPSHRFLTAFYMASLVILLIAIFRCRKQYIGKYI